MDPLPFNFISMLLKISNKKTNIYFDLRCRVFLKVKHKKKFPKAQHLSAFCSSPPPCFENRILYNSFVFLPFTLGLPADQPREHKSWIRQKRRYLSEN